MFCPNCGKELDANNVCINLACPTNSEPTSESENEASINNNSSINNTANNENTNSNQDSGYKEISDNDIHTNYNQNSNYNQGSEYNPNHNNNQYSGYNQNPNNQNFGYNQNTNYSQNPGYNQGNPFTDRNGVSASEMMDLLGPKNTEYYMDKWNRSQENPSFISWNWPAFLFGLVWFCFRKMYAIAGILFGVSFASAIILPGWAKSIVSLAIMIGCGLLANQIYIKQSIDKIRSIKLTTGFNTEILSQRLRATGGITWVPVIIFSILGGLLLILAIIGIIAAVALGSSYNNYGSFY